MTAISDVQNIRRLQANAHGGLEPTRPTGALPVYWVDGRPVPEPPAQGRLRSDVWWAEVARRQLAGDLDNRTLAAAYMNALLVEDDPARLYQVLVQAAAFATSWADGLKKPNGHVGR